MSERAPTAWRVIALAPALLVTVGLFGGALVGAAVLSLSPTGSTRGARGLDAWRRVLTDPAFLDASWFSLRLAVVSTLLSAVLAVALAAVLRRRPVVQALFTLPVLVPHLLVAVLAVVWLGPGGLADRVLGGLPIQLVRDGAGWGVLLVYLYKEVPFLALLVLAAWDREVDIRDEAAAVMGAGRVDRLRFVVWPAIRTPLAIGSLIVAAFVFGSFEVPLVVGPSYPPTVATYALDATRTSLLGGRADAAVALLVAAGASLIVAALAARLARSRDA